MPHMRPPGLAPAEAAQAHRSTASAVVIGVAVALLGADVSAVLRRPSDRVCAALALITIVAALAIAGARVRRRVNERGLWALIGAGVAIAAVGTTLTALSAGGVELSETVLRLPDLLWLGAYAAWYVATMLLGRRYLGGAHHSLWLDGLLVGLAASAYMSAVFLNELEPGRDSLQAAALLARPSADLALVALGAGMLFMIGRFSLQGVLLCAGLSVLLVGDILRLGDLAIADTAGTEVPVVSALGLVLIAAAGWTRPAPGRVLPVGGWWELTTPASLMTLAGAILVIDHSHRLPAAAIVLSAATFAAALARMVGTLREVRSLALHRREALTDDLTGLPNRRALFRELEVLTTPGARSSRRLALLQLDLDGFKELNDTLGHQAGDDLLVAVSRRLESVVPGTLARLGGDEFAAIVSDEHDARQVAQAIGEALEAPLDIEGVGISVRASVGIAQFPDDAPDARELARRADVAMYDAKRLGTVVAGYAAERDEHSRDRLSLAADLRRALEGGDELWLAFQPQVEIATGRITGAEALIRWRHPEQGEIPPGALLPVAERTGLMRQLTLWVLEHAISQVAEWRRHDLPLRVAVNVSAIVLVDATLPDRITSILARHALTPDNLVVEVTEDAVMSDTKRAIAILDRIKASGVEIAIDDFGTGHSSLEQLKNLPADELKLDRSFVLGMAEEPHDAAIVGSVIGLGKAMGLRIVAEGVETAVVWGELAALRCDVAQGFGLARPMPAVQFERWARQPPDVARRLVPSLHAAVPVRRGRAA